MLDNPSVASHVTARLKGIPTLEWPDEDVRGWADMHMNPRARFRRWIMIQAAQALWFYHGRHWLMPTPDLRTQQNFIYSFQEIYRSSFATYPRPVTNLIAPAVDNEVSRLGRRELVPDTHALKALPIVEQAAKASKNMLLWELAQQAWPNSRDQMGFDIVIGGTTILKSYWEESTNNLELVAAPDARICPNCRRPFASPMVPRIFAGQGMPGAEGPVEMLHRETLSEVEDRSGYAEVEMHYCPFCPEQSELKPYSVSPEEASREDALGRQLGTMLPAGKATHEVVWLYDLFPENGGLGVDPWDCKLWSQKTARSIDSVEEHYPELTGEIKPDPPEQLRRAHPLLGDPLFSGAAAVSISGLEGIYDNHVFVREIHVDPRPKPGLEEGASFVVVNDKVLRRPLVVKVKTPDGEKTVKRVQYGAARYRRIPKLFFGRSFVPDLISVNRRLNQLDAQVIDLRERGMPMIYVPEGTEIYKRDDESGSMRILEYSATDPQWKPADALMPGVPLSGNVYFQERNAILQDARTVGAPEDVEIGRAPKNIKTTTGLMVLGEEAAQERAPRERALIEMYEAAWNHFLEMNWAFRKTELTYRLLEQHGRQEREAFEDINLLGQVNVKIEKRASYDSKIYIKEATAEAINSGLYRLDTQTAVNRVLDLMELPKDVNEDSSIQVDRAEGAWQDFVDRAVVPVLDLNIVDAGIWFQVLGKRWLSDKGVDIQKSVGWPEIVRKLAGWEEKRQAAEEQDRQLRPIYGGAPPERWQQVYEQAQALAMRATASLAEAVKAAGQPAPVPQQVPPPPQRPFLPDLLQDRIYFIWSRILEQELQSLAIPVVEGLRPDLRMQQEAAERLQSVLQMKAAIEACRITDLGRRGMLAAGAPPQAAPGGSPGAPGQQGG